jgi:hypothetical protein
VNFGRRVRREVAPIVSRAGGALSQIGGAAIPHATLTGCRLPLSGEAQYGQPAINFRRAPLNEGAQMADAEDYVNYFRDYALSPDRDIHNFGHMSFGASTNSIPAVAWDYYEPSLYAIDPHHVSLLAQNSSCKPIVSSTAYLVAPHAFTLGYGIRASLEFFSPRAVQDGKDANSQQPAFPPLMGVIFGFKNGNATDDGDNDTLNYQVNCKFRPDGLRLAFTTFTAVLNTGTLKQFDETGTIFVVTVTLDIEARTATATLTVNGQAPLGLVEFQVDPARLDPSKDFSAIGVTVVNNFQGDATDAMFDPPYGTVSVKLIRFALTVLQKELPHPPR